MSNDPFGNSNNPYAQPSGFDSNQWQAQVPTTKPTSVTVFGILNIVFAVIGICGTGLGAVGLIFLANVDMPAGPPNPAVELMKESSAYLIFVWTSTFIGGILAIFQLVGGIGLLRSKRMGLTLSISYAWISIVVGILSQIASVFIVIMPTLEKIDKMGGGPEVTGARFGAIGGAIGGCAGLIYPVLLLIFLKRKIVTDYFSRMDS